MISGKENDVIMIIDDDKDVRSFIGAAIKSEGWQVLEASNGQEAFDYLKQITPGTLRLILLDMQMPVMDGWKFLPLYRQYQQEPENRPGAPVIVMTASLTLTRYANQINADGYLPKPFDLADLLTVVKTQLSSSPPG